MKISDLEFYLVAVPRSDSDIRVRALVVRLASDSGHEGWGEASLDWQPGQLDARRQALLPLLAGRSIFNIEEFLALDALRPLALKAAIEIASWDLIGRAVGQPLCHLFGGLYRGRVPLAARLPAENPESVGIRARELSERGFHTQIVTLVGDSESDRQRIARAIEATGDRVEFRIDGQGLYDLESAFELCNELERCDPIKYFLDPISHGDADLTGLLRRQTAIPLALRMRIRGTSDLFHIARVADVGHVVLPMAQVGGIHTARKCISVAEAAALSASLTAGLSVGVSLAAMLQLAGAAPNLSTGHESAYHDLADDILCERLELVDGMIAVPDGFGLGIEIDRRKLERYQIT